MLIVNLCGLTRRKYKTTMNTFIVCGALLVSAVTAVSNADQKEYIKKETFDVKPGGEEHTFEISVEDTDFTCSFTYRAQGGTKEAWLMVVEWVRDDHDEITCRVDRPGGTSYLFFQEFSLSVPSTKWKTAKADMLANEHKELAEEEFELDHTKNIVKQSANFKNSLTRAMLELRLRKTEL